MNFWNLVFELVFQKCVCPHENYEYEFIFFNAYFSYIFLIKNLKKEKYVP